MVYSYHDDKYIGFILIYSWLHVSLVHKSLFLFQISGYLFIDFIFYYLIKNFHLLPFPSSSPHPPSSSSPVQRALGVPFPVESPRSSPSIQV